LFTGGDMTKNEALRMAQSAFKEIASETYDPWTNGAKAQRIAEAVLVVIEQALKTPQALPDAITDNSESPEFRAGWNECREVMAGMMK
jgi:hypothetical protein